jgi:hypothetical protein
MKCFPNYRRALYTDALYRPNSNLTMETGGEKSPPHIDIPPTPRNLNTTVTSLRNEVVSYHWKPVDMMSRSVSYEADVPQVVPVFVRVT